MGTRTEWGTTDAVEAAAAVDEEAMWRRQMEQSTLRADGQVGECTGGAAPRKHSPRGLHGAQAEERRPDSTDGWNICLRTQIKWRWSRQWHTEPAQGTDQVRQEENEKGRRGWQGGCVVCQSHRGGWTCWVVADFSGLVLAVST